MIINCEYDVMCLLKEKQKQNETKVETETKTKIQLLNVAT